MVVLFVFHPIALALFQVSGGARQSGRWRRLKWTARWPRLSVSRSGRQRWWQQQGSAARCIGRPRRPLLEHHWVNATSSAGQLEMKAVGKELYMQPTDLAIKWDSELRAIAQASAVPRPAPRAVHLSAPTSRDSAPGRQSA
jgi:hypothetical protein